MRPRPHAHDRLQTEFLAELQKIAQQAAIGPIKLAALFLVMDPENVG